MHPSRLLLGRGLRPRKRIRWRGWLWLWMWMWTHHRASYYNQTVKAAAAAEKPTAPQLLLHRLDAPPLAVSLARSPELILHQWLPTVLLYHLVCVWRILATWAAVFFFCPSSSNVHILALSTALPISRSPQIAPSLHTHTHICTLSRLDLALNDLHFVWLSLNSPAAPICQSSH